MVSRLVIRGHLLIRLLLFGGKSLPGFPKQLEQIGIRCLLIGLLQLLAVGVGVEDVGAAWTLRGVGILLLLVTLLPLG